jgi:hypothetical protein
LQHRFHQPANVSRLALNNSFQQLDKFSFALSRLAEQSLDNRSVVPCDKNNFGTADDRAPLPRRG